MKRLTLVAIAALIALPACTTIHPDRRTLTEWNWELLTDGNQKVEAPKDVDSWSDTAYPVFDWLVVQPIALVMLPVSWAIDTVIVNPVNAFKKTQLDTHMDREGRYADLGTAEAAAKNYKPTPITPPWIVSDLLDLPRFAARWVWNSTYWSDPVDVDGYEEYWQTHYEVTAR